MKWMSVQVAVQKEPTGCKTIPQFTVVRCTWGFEPVRGRVQHPQYNPARELQRRREASVLAGVVASRTAAACGHPTLVQANRQAAA